MCQDCGCVEVGTVEIHGMPDKHSESHQHLGHDHAHNHDHAHDYDHAHEHDHPHPHTHTSSHTHSHTLTVQERILSKNDRFAADNRAQFHQHGLLALNMLSSPGAGKTSVIERMAQDFRHNDPVIREPSLELGVIVGDLATENDAVRLRQAGALALQITTGDACHLEADMVGQALSHFNLGQLDLLVIENVGNLVCPASYDLGEAVRVVLLSTTEGEDKPLKYPTMFKTADIVLVNKVDVAEVLGCNLRGAIANIQQVAPQATIFEVSARTGAGMMDFYQHLLSLMPVKKDTSTAQSAVVPITP